MQQVEGKAQCGKCGAPVNMTIAPAAVTNFDTCSVIVIEHSGQTLCPECGTVVRPFIPGLGGIGIVMAPVPPNQQQLILTPGGKTV
jgi:hypothetical protein